MQFFAFLNAVRKNQWQFWNPETNWTRQTGQDKLDKIDFIFEENFDFENLTFFDLIWPYIDLSLGQIQKCMPPSYFAFQMTNKTCVARQTCTTDRQISHSRHPAPCLCARRRMSLMTDLHTEREKYAFHAIQQLPDTFSFFEKTCSIMLMYLVIMVYMT